MPRSVLFRSAWRQNPQGSFRSPPGRAAILGFRNERHQGKPPIALPVASLEPATRPAPNGNARQAATIAAAPAPEPRRASVMGCGSGSSSWPGPLWVLPMPMPITSLPAPPAPQPSGHADPQGGEHGADGGAAQHVGGPVHGVGLAVGHEGLYAFVHGAQCRDEGDDAQRAVHHRRAQANEQQRRQPAVGEGVEVLVGGVGQQLLAHAADVAEDQNQAVEDQGQWRQPLSPAR